MLEARFAHSCSCFLRLVRFDGLASRQSKAFERICDPPQKRFGVGFDRKLSRSSPLTICWGTWFNANCYFPGATITGFPATVVACELLVNSPMKGFSAIFCFQPDGVSELGTGGSQFGACELAQAHKQLNLSTELGESSWLWDLIILSN